MFRLSAVPNSHGLRIELPGRLMSAEPVRSVSSVLSFGSAMSSGTRAPACVAAAALRRSASLSSVPTVMVDGGLDDWAPDVVAGAPLSA